MPSVAKELQGASAQHCTATINWLHALAQLTSYLLAAGLLLLKVWNQDLEIWESAHLESPNNKTIDTVIIQIRCPPTKKCKVLISRETSLLNVSGIVFYQFFCGPKTRNTCCFLCQIFLGGPVAVNLSQKEYRSPSALKRINTPPSFARGSNAPQQPLSGPSLARVGIVWRGYRLL